MGQRLGQVKVRYGMFPQGLYTMPIPGMTEEFDLFNERAKFEYLWSFWPRRCYVTGRLLFGTLAVRGRAMWTGPGEPVIEDRWYDRNEAVILMLKGLQYGN